jgi:hypothetical protein
MRFLPRGTPGAERFAYAYPSRRRFLQALTPNSEKPRPPSTKLVGSGAPPPPPPVDTSLTLTIARIFCCGLVGGARAALGMLTVYLCPSRVNDGDADVSVFVRVDAVAVNPPERKPLNVNAPEWCVA